MFFRTPRAHPVKVEVGIGEFRLAHGSALLTTCSLGSCVGVVLYDQACELAGLAHCMLPDPTSINGEDPETRGKCVAIALPSMIERLRRRCKAGSTRHLRAYLVGGAAMFALGGEDPQALIGYRNAAKAAQILEQLRIPIVLREVGENYGRALEFAADTGLLTIRTTLRGTRQFRWDGRPVLPGAEPEQLKRG